MHTSGNQRILTVIEEMVAISSVARHEVSSPVAISMYS